MRPPRHHVAVLLALLWGALLVAGQPLDGNSSGVTGRSGVDTGPPSAAAPLRSPAAWFPTSALLARWRLTAAQASAIGDPAARGVRVGVRPPRAAAATARQRRVSWPPPRRPRPPGPTPPQASCASA